MSDNDESSSLENWYKGAIEQAIAGDRDMAIELLREFAKTDPCSKIAPLLQGYVAKCVLDWLDTDCNPKDAPPSFHVQRAAHREADASIYYKHCSALRVYFLMRGRKKKPGDAIRIAAQYVHLSEDSIEKLLTPPAPAPNDKLGLSLPQAAALYSIQSRRVRERCLNAASQT